MSIRDESVQLGEALLAMGVAFADGDKEGFSEWANIVFKIGTEAYDVAKAPKQDRLNAFMLAGANALAGTANKAIKFSDEV
jgi:hypothetical protein